MSDEEVKAWMRDNRKYSEDAAALAEAYCDEHDARGDDGEVPDEINVLATEVFEEDEDDSDGEPDEDDSDGEPDEDDSDGSEDNDSDGEPDEDDSDGFEDEE